MNEGTREPGTVTLGGLSVTVQRFSTFKVIEATAIVTSVMEEIPELGEKIATFQRTYAAENEMSISRATAELRYPPEQLANISEEAWAASDNRLVVPGSPSVVDIAAHVFPDVFRVAQEQILRLLALVAAPNDELRRADEAGNVEEYLSQKAKALRHEDAGELLDLLVATAEVLTDQFDTGGDRLGPLGRLIGFRAPASDPVEGTATPVEIRTAEETPTSSTPATSKPASRTYSDPPTDGPEASPSTGSPTPTPAASGG